MLLDLELVKYIIGTTTTILREHFFYDNEALHKFLDCYQRRLCDEYIELDESVDDEFRFELKYDYDTRRYFTSYFASINLNECLVDDLFFDDFELNLFENILPKHTGAESHDIKSSEQGTNYRELFEGL